MQGRHGFGNLFLVGWTVILTFLHLLCPPPSLFDPFIVSAGILFVSCGREMWRVQEWPSN